MLAISKVSASKELQPYQPIKVTVHVDEWRELYREKDPWTDLARAADRLKKRVVTMHPQEKDVPRKKMNWTDSCEYQDSRVVIIFGYSLSTELAGMHEHFTQTTLLDVAKLGSFYTIRLHELLMQFASTGCLMITVDELRDIMNVSDKYARFAQFNQRVIKLAVEEIQSKMPNLKLTVEYVKRKYSRSITSLTFRFKKTKQSDHAYKPESAKDNKFVGEKFNSISNEQPQQKPPVEPQPPVEPATEDIAALNATENAEEERLALINKAKMNRILKEFAITQT